MQVLVMYSSVKFFVIEICEQASITLHHINRAKLYSENSASGISFGVGGQLTPEMYSREAHGYIKLRTGPMGIMHTWRILQM